jgi:cephalosporin-C deacetylase
MAIPGLERFKPNAYRPPDFLSFWSQTVADTEACEPGPELGPPESAESGIDLRELRFHSLGGVAISAYFARPVSGQSCPLIVHAHGYDDRYTIMTDWARRGAAVLGFDVRGFGRSRAAAATSEHGYVLTGIESPESSILRGAVADYVQAVRVARQLLNGRDTRVVCHGFSFGGALALMGAALCPAVDLVAIGQPTFGWNAERRRVALGGSTHQLNRFISAEPRLRDRVWATLEYFDTMHFAPLIRSSALVGIGLDDDVVPSRTVLAVVNHMRCRVEVRLLPVSHSADPRESLWRAFHEEWLEYTIGGLPPDFGTTERQIRTLVA